MGSVLGNTTIFVNGIFAKSEERLYSNGFDLLGLGSAMLRSCNAEPYLLNSVVFGADVR